MPNTKLTYKHTTTLANPLFAERERERESWASPNKYQFTAKNNTETVSEALAIDTYIRYTNTKHEEMNNKSSEIATKLNSIATKLLSQATKLNSEHAKLIEEPTKLLSEVAKLFAEPTKLISGLTKLISEHAKLFSEHAKLISEPTKLLSEVNDEPLLAINTVNINTLTKLAPNYKLKN